MTCSVNTLQFSLKLELILDIGLVEQVGTFSCLSHFISYNDEFGVYLGIKPLAVCEEEKS